jgi:hypothetical protein
MSESTENKFKTEIVAHIDNQIYTLASDDRVYTEEEFQKGVAEFATALFSKDNGLYATLPLPNDRMLIIGGELMKTAKYFIRKIPLNHANS